MIGLLFDCEKAAPKRPKRVHPHPTATAPAADDDSPVAPGPVAERAADAPPPPRHQLSVDPNPPPLVPPAAAPSVPPPHHAARVPVPVAVPRPVAAPVVPAPRAVAAATPTPEAPVAYKPVADKRPGAWCEGGDEKGELLSVHGVAADDVLNVRESPDRASTILGELPPDATGVRGTANRKRIGASSWREIECGKLRGWVNERFLAREATHSSR